MEKIEVMEPVLSDKVVSGKEWIHQVKWDGIRGIACLQDQKIQLFTKNGRERSEYYPELGDLFTLFKGTQAVFDGEIVVFDEDNRPSFDLILFRERVRTRSNLPHYVRSYPIHYIVFDLLFLNGTDLRSEPLEKRKELLLQHLGQGQRIAVTDDFPDGQKLFQMMKDKRFEGIVSKKKTSIYIPGKKHSDWIKTKIYKKVLTAVGGISWKAGYPNSLLLGIYQNERFLYVGNASSGLTQQDLRLLKDYSSTLSQDQSPFANLLKAKDTTWFKPVLTCWVGFLEWTDQMSLRHPKILGFSNEPTKNAAGKEYFL